MRYCTLLLFLIILAFGIIITPINTISQVTSPASSSSVINVQSVRTPAKIDNKLPVSITSKVVEQREEYNNNATQITLNTSYIEPGESLDIIIHSEEWFTYENLTNNFVNNSFSYTLTSPINQQPISSDPEYILNATPSGVQMQNYSWSGQELPVSQEFLFNSFANGTQNDATVHVIVTMPQYPAVLGTWQFLFTINRNATASTQLNYAISFTLNTSLVFTHTATLVERGTWQENENISHPNWVRDEIETELNSTFSPGDHVLFLGTLGYETSPNTIINLTQIQLTGMLSLQKVDASTIELGNLIRLEQGIFSHNLNATEIQDMNNHTTAVFEIEIPLQHLLGDFPLTLKVTFPENQSFATFGYDSSRSLGNLNIAYHLGIDSFSGESTYYLTTRFVGGTVSISAYHIKDLTSLYPATNVDNISNSLDILADTYQIDIKTYLNGSSVSLFTIMQQGNIWEWERIRLDTGVKQGNYSLKFLWNDNQDQPIKRTSDIYASATESFQFDFTIEAHFYLQDLTSSLELQAGDESVLRFKIIVNETGVVWDREVKLTASEIDDVFLGPVEFRAIVGEYALEVVLPLGLSPGDRVIMINATSMNFSLNTLILHVVGANPSTIVESERVFGFGWIKMVGGLGILVLVLKSRKQK